MTSPTGIQQSRMLTAPPAPPTGTLVPSAAPPSGTPEFSPPPPSRTPQLLRRLQAATALAVLVLGGVGMLLIGQLRTDLDSAPQLAAQYSRLGEVQTQLLEAGTLAAEGVIQGNGSATDRAASAADRLGAVSSLLVQAATARPQDAAALSGLNSELTVYASTLRAADGRDAKAAQGLLAKAGEQLDKKLLPDLAALRQSLSTEASTGSVNLVFMMPILGLAAAAVLGWASWVLAQRSRRVLNVGLVAGIVAVLVISWVTVAAQLSTAAAAGASRGAQFARVSGLTEASDQIGAARRLQTTALVSRSWSSAQAKSVTAAIDAAQSAAKANGASSPSLATYRAAEQDLAAVMAKADWAAADKLALSSEKTGVAASSAQFQKAISEARTTATTAAASTTDEVRGGLPWQLAAVILAAIVGAGLAVAGIAQRLVDYR